MTYGAKISHSALVAAIVAKDVDLLQFLLSREGVDPNMRKVGKEVALWTSANGQSTKPTIYDPNCADELYPIHYVLVKECKDDDTDVSARVFDLLLAHGTHLHAKYERTTVVHRLLGNRGESMNIMYSGENSFLLRVSKYPNVDIEVRDGEGSTVLLHACQLGRSSAINALLDRGADFPARDNKNHNPLHLF